jgi:cytochrome c biogenesis protein CcdA
MFNLNDKLDEAIKSVAFAVAAAAAGVAAFFFFCLALFLWTQQQFGTVTAALALAFLFLLVAVSALVATRIIRKQSAERQLQSRKQSALLWRDPLIINTALDVLRTIGSKRLTTMLLGMFVVGVLLSRPNESQSVNKPGK